jgi:lipid-binding SYLF domain-containing protein
MDGFCSSDGNAGGESVHAIVHGEGEDIEASTIRGMIELAVGLGFVQLLKVVVGVSLQGGSGILISRLPDGTWLAPSSMGVYGLGVGLQFGLEVCDFVFIIQARDGNFDTTTGTCYRDGASLPSNGAK